MNIFAGVRKAGIIGKSLGYAAWGIKETAKLTNKVAKRGFNAVTQRRQYKAHLQTLNPDTGEYNTHTSDEKLTSVQALNLMDSMDYFPNIIVEVTKEKK
tara:strand:+ start:73 stop:369 length:297 start_codon:yes stop_codon:yes gene_type:complete